MQTSATIAALSTGSLPSGVAVVRLSGPEAFAAVRALCGGLPVPRTLALKTLRHPTSGIALDQGLVAIFPAPNSFTGEDCAELQVHGSPAGVKAILTALTGACGLELAAAGDFTRRAFENGKLDLTAVEGLGDLLAAELGQVFGEDMRNCTLAGPTIEVDATAAQSLGLTFHELATNAAKYGALSNEVGKVLVTWSIDQATSTLDLRWSEEGGPPVTAPTRRGFGRIVIERNVARSLEAEVDLDFATEGFRAVFHIPLDQIRPRVDEERDPQPVLG
jgi:hypothetical protein